MKTITVIVAISAAYFLVAGCTRQQTIKLAEPIALYLTADCAEPDTITVVLLDGRGSATIKSLPSMTITNVCSIAPDTSTTIYIIDGKEKKVTTATIAVTLTPKDAIHFGELTRQNLGRRMLVQWGGDYLTAPMIREPLLNGSFCWSISSNEQNIVNRHWAKQQNK